ncbi:hypothetical protein [Croceicoccus sp. Ery15]|jgi:hypothetical protein|uniref:hypothetical protein n=1 Tax=Croceicoccus sp. Ery15 TaxID=1703338 RepID=UPI001E2E7C25|nr:hypothetical protein [Croceicoccus sp. Ery15]
MTGRSPLDDPHNAQFAWARYKRMMKFMLALTLTTIVLVLGWLTAENGLLSIHFYIAWTLGIGFMMMLVAALMGLVFLSNGTGHDAAIDDRMGEEAKDFWSDDPERR